MDCSNNMQDAYLVYTGCKLRDANGKPFVFSAKAHYGSDAPILNEKQTYMMLWPVNVEVLNGDSKLKQTPGYDR